MTQFCLRLLGIALVLTLIPSILAAQLNVTKVSTRLEQRLVESPHDYHHISILLTDCVDVRAMDKDLYARNATLEDRTYEVITALRAKAQETQTSLLRYLDLINGVDRNSIESYWITNAIFVKATVSVIEELSQRPDVYIMDINAPLKLHDFKRETEPVQPETRMSAGYVAYGVDAINAPALWALGYTGYERVAMSLVSVDRNHPAIAENYRARYAPEEWSLHPNLYHVPDCNVLGTHTIGTTVGIDQEDQDTIGVAFNGLWAHSYTSCLEYTNANIDALEWAIDPDGNPATIIDMVDVINFSRYDPSLPNQCDPNNIYKLTLDAVEAVGVAVVFAAGDDGPALSTITSPQNINTDLVNTFCVGNVSPYQAHYTAHTSSSRGPSICGGSGSLLIKPEVAAPGKSIRSSIPGGGFDMLTSTAMAAAHVSGAILLLKEAFPTLTGTELKLALYYSCTDIGVEGEDNTYGMGLINVEAAYYWLISQGHTPAPLINENNATINGIQNLDPELCTDEVAPVLVLGNQGNQNLTSAKIIYSYFDLINEVTDSITWTGNLPPFTQQTVSLPITILPPKAYTLTIKVELPNGVPDDRRLDNLKTVPFKVVYPVPPTTSDITICQNGNGILTATPPTTSTNSVQWFTDPTGGLPIGYGNTFITPNLPTTTTFYASVPANVRTGKEDYNEGTGEMLSNTEEYLIFDAYVPFVLKSVLVYADVAGNRTVEVRDSDGNVLKSKTVYIPAGEQRVQLNMAIPEGDDLRLGTSGQSNMYRSDSGVDYPYEVWGVLHIDRSSAFGDPLSYYYFYYDWEIEYDSPCGRAEAKVFVQIGANINAAFSSSTNTIDLAVGGSVDFVDQTVANVAEWSWDFGDGNTSTFQNPSHTYTQTGTYTVTLTVTSPGGCTDVSTIELVVTGAVGIEEDLALLNGISVYPNPNTGLFTLSFDIPNSQALEISLVDMLGKEVMRQSLTPRPNDKLPIDLTEMNAGIYYLKLSTNGNSIVKKIVKQ